MLRIDLGTAHVTICHFYPYKKAKEICAAMAVLQMREVGINFTQLKTVQVELEARSIWH